MITLWLLFVFCYNYRIPLYSFSIHSAISLSSRQQKCNRYSHTVSPLKRLIIKITKFLILALLILHVSIPTIDTPEFVQLKKYKLLGVSSTKQQVREAVIEEFGHKFAKVVECESGFQIKAKNINTNKSVDSGLFQINSVHNKTAQKMGIDLKTIDGQFIYAKHLISKNGYNDWVCARKLGIKM